MLSEHIDPNQTILEFWIRRLDQFVISVLLIVQRIESLDDELEQRLQVFRRRRRHEDVGVAEGDGSGEREAHGRRFSSSTASGERAGYCRLLLGDDVEKSEQGLCLTSGTGSREQRTNRFCLFHGFFETGELQVGFAFQFLEIEGKLG